MNIYVCPNCDETDLVAHDGSTATCGVCGTTFDAYIAPEEICSCTDQGICSICMVSLEQIYEHDEDEEQRLVSKAEAEEMLGNVQIWLHKF